MRLIDADALEKRMYVIPYYDNRDEDAVIDEIYKAPTVDVAPVVRCKECKHWYEYSCNEEYGSCHFWQANDNENTETESDDFCSYGQRKE